MEASAVWEMFGGMRFTADQRIWINHELEHHPPAVGENVSSWLLCRSKIAEGMTEAEARAWVEMTARAEDPSLAPPSAVESSSSQKSQGMRVADNVIMLSGDNTASKLQDSYSTANSLSVATENILPPAPEGYDDLEDAIGSPEDASGSSAGDAMEDDALEGPAAASERLAFDLITPGHDVYRFPPRRPIMIGRPLCRGGHSPSYTTSPYAGSGIADRVRPRHDSSSIDPPPPRVVRPVPKSPTKTPSTTKAPISATAVPGPDDPVTMEFIRTLLTVQRLRADKPFVLWKYLRRQNDGEDPPRFEPSPAELREIVGAIRTHALPDYKQAMADNLKYSKQIGRWLRSMHKNMEHWAVAISPLIVLLSETDMAVNVITEYKIARYCKEIEKKAREMDLPKNDLITNSYKRYESQVQTKLLKINREIPLKEESEAGKKRKAADNPTSAATAKIEGDKKPVNASSVDKKPTISPKTSEATPVSKTDRAASNPAKPATAAFVPRTGNAIAGPSRPGGAPAAASSTSGGLSFFGGNASAPPAKKARSLPNFKKRDPSDSVGSPSNPGAGPSTPAVPLPSVRPPPVPPAPSHANSLLATTLARVRAGNTQTTTQPLPVGVPVPSLVRKPNKKGHMVKFVPDAELKKVKMFEQELWELEFAPWQFEEDGITPITSLNPPPKIASDDAVSHDMTLSEGMTLRSEHAAHRDHSSEHMVDWYAPEQYNPQLLLPATPETLAQESRERGILTAPDRCNADESGVRIVHAMPDKLYQLPAALNIAAAPIQQTVSQLLSKINMDQLGGLGLANLGAGAPMGMGAVPPPVQNHYAQPPVAYPYEQQQQGYGAPNQYPGHPSQPRQSQQHNEYPQQPQHRPWETNSGRQGQGNWNRGGGTGWNDTRGRGQNEYNGNRREAGNGWRRG